jgi:hypothetical protein
MRKAKELDNLSLHDTESLGWNRNYSVFRDIDANALSAAPGSSNPPVLMRKIGDGPEASRGSVVGQHFSCPALYSHPRL